MSDPLRRTFDVVTEHNLAVIVLLLVVTAGVVAGVGHLQLQSDSDPREETGGTEVAQKMSYVQAAYGSEAGANGTATSPAAVYVRTGGENGSGNALSKAALLDSLRYQQEVRENESVAAGLGGREVAGVANLVARQAAGDPDATLAEQIAALEGTSEAEVDRLVAATLREGSPALRLVPADYEPGTTTAASHRMVFPLADDQTRTAATAALYETATERDTGDVAAGDGELAYFTAGQHASAARNAQYLGNTMELVVPAALLVILAVLAFSYRDLVDVVVGFTGVVVSVLWMFGILGWLGIPAGMSLIIGPVLIVGLSVDYGLHVFMRYREQREALRASEERAEGDDVRESMARGLSSVAAALGLVTLTAMVGFMANATNEFTVIEQLAYAITLGVLSTFVVTLTLVPALKVTIDRLLERVGFDRRTPPLGKTGRLKPLLSGGVTLAVRAAPAVIVVALLVGAAGAVTWTDLDRQSLEQRDGEIAEWKQDLPGPLAWDVSEESRQRDYVAEHYRAADEDARSQSTVLLEDDVTDPGALASVRAVHDAAADSDVVYTRGGSAQVTSPLTVMRTVAAEDEDFAETFHAADTDGDGVPDRNVAGVYDALFATAPEQASQVIDRQDGEYRSLRVVVPVQSDVTIADRAEGMRTVAAAGENAADETGIGETGSVSATAVGSGTVQDAEFSRTAESVLETLVIALVTVGVLLTVVYRVVAGSATLGAVTAVPIVLVSALVIGGMWLLDVPLTLLTALLLSLVIGIGIDYNIHVSDRFARECERGRPVHEALVEATTGTGGALLGSTLTSAGAFSALLLHPSPQFQNFGALVVLAMVTSFVVAVFVLPSMLSVWARYVPSPTTDDAPTGAAAATDD